ncbi:MAG: xanthine dehydrogenase family protein subunit M [Chloroflexi bacterium]|nr:xanthine dehydrogenase family protein subunit M [Chloroflexota bacterium]
MKDFRYVEPKSIEEAVAFLGTHPGEARVLAGGTDLLIKMNRRLISPRYLVNLKNVPALDRIGIDQRGYLSIGALSKINAVYRSSVVRERWEPIALAAGQMASVQVRNVATAGGNLCNAAPSADFAPIMISMGAEVRIFGGQGIRTVPLENFFSGPGRTVLAPDEVMTEILVPPPPPGSASVYLKHGIRKAMDIAVVGAAISLRRDGQKCRGARIVLGAVAPIPMRARAAEKVLEGAIVDEPRARLAGEAAAEESRPITDVRGSEYYRRKVTAALVERGIMRALVKIEDRGR